VFALIRKLFAFCQVSASRREAWVLIIELVVHSPKDGARSVLAGVAGRTGH